MNEEIQQKAEWENLKNICYFEFSSSGFSSSQYKRAEIKNKKFCHYLPYFYTYSDMYHTFKKLKTKISMKQGRVTLKTNCKTFQMLTYLDPV